MSEKEVVPPGGMLQPSRWSDRPKLLSLRRGKWRRHACGYRRQGHFKDCELISQIECLLWASQAATLLLPWGWEEVSGCSEWGRLHQQDGQGQAGKQGTVRQASCWLHRYEQKRCQLCHPLSQRVTPKQKEAGGRSAWEWGCCGAGAPGHA